MTDVEQPSLTRAQRRRDRYTTTREELSGPLVLVRALAVLAIAGLAVLAVHAGPLFVAGLLVWAAAGIAWGWPQVAALSSGWRLSFVVVLTGLLVAAAVVTVEDDPRLRLVPVALAIGIVVTFLLQLLRSDGRTDLTLEVIATATAVAVIGIGAGLVGTALHRHGTELITISMAAVGAAALADPLATRLRDRSWLVPVAMVLGALAALGAASALGGLTWGVALLLGMFVGALSYAVRTVVAGEPASHTLAGVFAAACASVLSVGALTQVATLVLSR